MVGDGGCDDLPVWSPADSSSEYQAGGWHTGAQMSAVGEVDDGVQDR